MVINCDVNKKIAEKNHKIGVGNYFFFIFA